MINETFGPDAAVMSDGITLKTAALELAHRLARRCADQAHEIVRLHFVIANLQSAIGQTAAPAAEPEHPAIAAIATMQRQGIR